MAQYKVCNTSSYDIAYELGVCLTCIREKPEEALPLAMEIHKRSRAAFGLPEEPPKDPEGIPCNICVNECRIPAGGRGFCGVRANKEGKLEGVTSEEGKLSWYHDPLPTNCVADWVCPGGTGAGYPAHANCPGPEYGFTNLAVFFHACSFNCLYCQNWHYRNDTLKPETRTINDLVSDVDSKTACICYFGGDPTPQLPFALKASETALNANKDRILRICWESNGSMNRAYMKRMIKLSLESGGSIKFDLKAWDENLHKALTGITNKRTVDNFKFAGEFIKERPVPQLLVASTLLVPGYIDEQEVRRLSKFIASVDPEIPYSLLAFYPHFYMKDISTTSRKHAEACLEVARDEGLKNLRLGNIHLLL
jgi:pyruvate formate lyase activating enzyme